MNDRFRHPILLAVALRNRPEATGFPQSGAVDHPAALNVSR
jgi:hypothetical protein